MSRVFEEVRSRLRNGHLDANTALHRLQMLMNEKMRHANVRTSDVVQKLSPGRLQMKVTAARAAFEAASSGCQEGIEARFQEARERLGLMAASLDALSPLAVLQRGYAIAQDSSGKLLRDASAVTVGDEISVRLAKGRLKTEVLDVESIDKP